jgi:hypothetical protein
MEILKYFALEILPIYKNPLLSERNQNFFIFRTRKVKYRTKVKNKKTKLRETKENLIHENVSLPEGKDQQWKIVCNENL